MRKEFRQELYSQLETKFEQNRFKLIWLNNMKAIGKVSIGVFTAILLVTVVSPKAAAVAKEIPAVQRVLEFFAVKKGENKTEFYDSNNEKVGEGEVIKNEVNMDEIKAQAERIYQEAKAREDELIKAESEGLTREDLPNQPQNWSDAPSDLPGFFPSAEDIKQGYIDHASAYTIKITDKDGNNLGGIKVSKDTSEEKIIELIEENLKQHYRTYKISENKKLKDFLKQYFAGLNYETKTEGNITTYTYLQEPGKWEPVFRGSGVRVVVDRSKGVVKGYYLNYGQYGAIEQDFDGIRFKIDEKDNLTHWPVDLSKWKKGMPLTEEVIDENGW